LKSNELKKDEEIQRRDDEIKKKDEQL